MIPTVANEEQHETYVSNIVRSYRSATPDQLRRGRSWYPTAHQLAVMIADGDAVQGAGVIASLSANKSWSENQRLAKIALSTGTPVGHVGDALGKASRILAGSAPEDVLPMGAKTGHFYRCIVDPSDADAVCVDRHAHDVAVGEVYGDRDRGLSSKRRYATVAHAYREAARRLGVLPQVVQAVTWVVQVETIASVGNRRRNRKGDE